MTKTAQYSAFERYTDGAAATRRRWMKEIFEALLCMPGPYLRSGDVEQRVTEFQALQDSPQKDQVPFRGDTSCMRCHAALDEAAAVSRSSKVAGWISDFDYDDDGIVEGDKINFQSYFAPQPSLGDGPAFHLQLKEGNSLSQSQFAFRSPKGRLTYRSHTGVLIEQVLNPIAGGSGSDLTPEEPGDNGIAALGIALAEGDSLYVCTASRLIEHFTGVMPNLADPGNPSNPPLSLDEQRFKDWAIELASGLKQSQDLRKLVKQILQSQLYRNQGFRKEGAP
jgi:hypothetical protein